jgi:hypothetical protein
MFPLQIANILTAKGLTISVLTRKCGWARWTALGLMGRRPVRIKYGEVY